MTLRCNCNVSSMEKGQSLIVCVSRQAQYLDCSLRHQKSAALLFSPFILPLQDRTLLRLPQVLPTWPLKAHNTVQIVQPHNRNSALILSLQRSPSCTPATLLESKGSGKKCDVRTASICFVDSSPRSRWLRDIFFFFRTWGFCALLYQIVYCAAYSTVYSACSRCYYVREVGTRFHVMWSSQKLKYLN
jgi:hypothetical protein